MTANRGPGRLGPPQGGPPPDRRAPRTASRRGRHLAGSAAAPRRRPRGPGQPWSRSAPWRSWPSVRSVISPDCRVLPWSPPSPSRGGPLRDPLVVVRRGTPGMLHGRLRLRVAGRAPPRAGGSAGRPAPRNRPRRGGASRASGAAPPLGGGLEPRARGRSDRGERPAARLERLRSVWRDQALGPLEDHADVVGRAGLEVDRRHPDELPTLLAHLVELRLVARPSR